MMTVIGRAAAGRAKTGATGPEEGRKPDIKTSETLYYSYICKPY